MEKRHKPGLNFDDTNLPVNDLTPERIEEIDKLAMPILQEALNKLRKEKPHLFKSPKK